MRVNVINQNSFVSSRFDGGKKGVGNVVFCANSEKFSAKKRADHKEALEIGFATGMLGLLTAVFYFLINK